MNFALFPPVVQVGSEISKLPAVALDWARTTASVLAFGGHAPVSEIFLSGVPE